jgi:cathepsin B
MKTFGTILNDHPKIFKLSSSVKSTAKLDISIPKTFAGNIVWSQYLSQIINQGNCGNCWAISTSKCLSDRFNIFCLGQRLVRFSSYELTICESVLSDRPPYDKDVLSQVNLAAHSTRACYGNSIISALKHLYIYGIVEYKCFTDSIQARNGIKQMQSFSQIGDLPQCESILGLDYDRCANEDTAARFFRCMNYYSLESDPESIKKEIYKFGPVIGGFMIFDNFLNNYDGKTIYMGPEKSSDKKKMIPLGGHAIRIVGWGEEIVGNENIEYWIIANSWGQDWGMDGYFRMKIGIPECQLENNIYGLIPDIPTLNIDNIKIPLQVDPEVINLRSVINIDRNTGYKLSAIRKILNRQLISTYKTLFDNKKLPNYETFVAAKVFKYPDTTFSFPVSDYFKILFDKNKAVKYDIIFMPNLMVFSIALFITLLVLFYKKKSYL